MSNDTGSRWPASLAASLEQALGAAVSELGRAGLSAEHYRSAPDILTLEARLGPAHRKPGHSVHAVLQVFDPRWPNLSLMRVLERRDGDGRPTEESRVPVYSRGLDAALSLRFVPVVNSLLNPFDPLGREESLCVGCYQGRIAPSDALRAPAMAFHTLRTYRREGQLAVIWVDFQDPLAVPAVRLVRSLTARRDVHLIPRTRTPSELRTVVRSPSGRMWHVGAMSTAVDEGLALARDYLNRRARTGGETASTPA
ncbi:hypothetical protein AB0C51_17165 [Streptomyces pathocidini]|uniref:hypothetical protein n=1 Tax=Streptomyces pathocidini TaxID=1650571 RepID=UPI0033E37BFF